MIKRIKALRSVTARVKPDAAWVLRTRVTLLERASRDIAAEPAKGFLANLLTGGAVWMRSSAMAALSVIAIVLGGSVASVSAAESSLPGDFLYSLKLATEQARLAFTSQKEDKLKLKMEFTARRVEDLKQVAQESGPMRDTRVGKATEMLKSDLKSVKQQLDQVKQETSPQKTVEIAKLVDAKTNELVNNLQIAKPTLSAKEQGKVIEVQAAAADAGVKAIEVLVEKHEEDNNSVAKTDVVQAIQDHTATVANATGDASLMATSSSITAQGINSSSMEKIKTATILAFAQASSSTFSLIDLPNSATSTPVSINITVTSTSDSGATTSVTITTTNSSDLTPSSTNKTSP